MTINIPRDVRDILAKLELYGHEAYVVGGCVRDALQGKQPKDWDITSSAMPKEVKRYFARTFDTGIKHGTVTVVLDHANYEVTTYRTDGVYSDMRHPDTVTFTRKLEDDLARRDFTINAMAYNPARGIVDPFGGQKDLAARLVSCVGNPRERFNEDALRMMRAARFAGQLNALIEKKTYDAIVSTAPNLCHISVERIRDEFVKIMMNSPYCLNILIDTGLINHFPMPAPLEDEARRFAREMNLSALSFDGNKLPYNLAVALAVLLRGRDRENAAWFLRKWRFDNNTVRKVSALIHWSKQGMEGGPANFRRFVAGCGKCLFKEVIAVKLLTRVVGEDKTERALREFELIIDHGDCLSIKDLKIDGHVLMSMGYVGREIGGALSKLLDAVLDDPSLNDRDKLAQILQS
ncbi:MAG: CCA tRNA nucleotidyltransferase [Clostridiales bacterium]|jgi:tRNA nucleotidyltransferase (CCA-adding enzyme)|nr:CCA tRNA nucleotidyltransferase [Clostridiales bacterium]